MPDFSRVTGFEWDEGNSRKSVDTHGVSQSEAEQVFLDPRLLILLDDRHSGGEKRLAAYGRTVEGRRFHVNFTFRSADTLIRVISARAMSRGERARYDQEI